MDSLVGSGSDRRVEKVVAISALLGEAGDDRADAREAGLEEPRRVVAKALSPESGDCDEGLIGRWPEFYPPAAHWAEELPHSWIVVSVGEGGSPVALLTPDGRTTAEVHVSPEGERRPRPHECGSRRAGEPSGIHRPRERRGRAGAGRKAPSRGGAQTSDMGDGARRRSGRLPRQPALGGAGRIGCRTRVADRPCRAGGR